MRAAPLSHCMEEGAVEGPRKQRSVYSVEVQRGGPDGWHSQRISPDWVHAFHAADAAVQAFDRYMDDSGESVASLAPSGANGVPRSRRPSL